MEEIIKNNINELTKRERIIKDDINELIKRFNLAKNGKEMIRCANDLSNIMDAANLLKCKIDVKKEVPSDLVLMFFDLEKFLQKERDNITQQIYDNLDMLESLYTDFINEFKKYSFSFNGIKIVKDININVFHEFFSQYGNMDEEFNKILNNELLFVIGGNTQGASINLRTLNKQYVFVSLDDYNFSSRSIAHEMGHVHAFNNTFDDNTDDYNFLTEFMSFLIELLYINYDNTDIDYKEVVNVIYIMYLLALQSLDQIKLMKKYKDAFVSFKLNPKYKDEFSKIRSSSYEFQRNILYSQIYSIDYLLAIKFYYYLKYGVDFNEIDKFYIENNCKNDLKTLLSYIDMDSVKQYLNELNINKQYKKR